ncbi:MAG: hypothetical protein CMI62_05040 [Parvibaculum sp.]|nr:hypothetical protein [Parvibaculum sp.]
MPLAVPGSRAVFGGRGKKGFLPDAALRLLDCFAPLAMTEEGGRPGEGRAGETALWRAYSAGDARAFRRGLCDPRRNTHLVSLNLTIL